MKSLLCDLVLIWSSPRSFPLLELRIASSLGGFFNFWDVGFRNCKNIDSLGILWSRILQQIFCLDSSTSDRWLCVCVWCVALCFKYALQMESWIASSLTWCILCACSDMAKQWIIATWLLVAVAGAHFMLVSGNSSGAPQRACADMLPQHSGSAQTAASPYTVTHNIPSTYALSTTYRGRHSQHVLSQCFNRVCPVSLLSPAAYFKNYWVSGRLVMLLVS